MTFSDFISPPLSRANALKKRVFAKCAKKTAFSHMQLQRTVTALFELGLEKLSIDHAKRALKQKSFLNKRNGRHVFVLLIL